MGLADDIKKAFFTGMGEDRLDSTQKSVLDKMSKDIIEAAQEARKNIQKELTNKEE